MALESYRWSRRLDDTLLLVCCRVFEDVSEDQLNCHSGVSFAARQRSACCCKASLASLFKSVNTSSASVLSVANGSAHGCHLEWQFGEGSLGIFSLTTRMYNAHALHDLLDVLRQLKPFGHPERSADRSFSGLLASFSGLPALVFFSRIHWANLDLLTSSASLCLAGCVTLFAISRR
ncbi:hypothetical protein K491DRAFT_218883 [Lophiostoma macrostomum CBS 122681]|uniref:Uncharacterized protein n=1 Tax=Lophiostoma macrostomum CBS 122681 TaxID=1314788 RepID=A0A6A6SR89_9PLEO|nr:hypothetical protein K491DRAFT_218883 [Lophiostoma macrostomum CBS 122681]